MLDHLGDFSLYPSPLGCVETIRVMTRGFLSLFFICVSPSSRVSPAPLVRGTRGGGKKRSNGQPTLFFPPFSTLSLSLSLSLFIYRSIYVSFPRRTMTAPTTGRNRRGGAGFVAQTTQDPCSLLCRPHDRLKKEPAGIFLGSCFMRLLGGDGRRVDRSIVPF